MIVEVFEDKIPAPRKQPETLKEKFDAAYRSSGFLCPGLHQNAAQKLKKLVEEMNRALAGTAFFKIEKTEDPYTPVLTCTKADTGNVVSMKLRIDREHINSGTYVRMDKGGEKASELQDINSDMFRKKFAEALVGYVATNFGYRERDRCMAQVFDQELYGPHIA